MDLFPIHNTIPHRYDNRQMLECQYRNRSNSRTVLPNGWRKQTKTYGYVWVGSLRILET
jgi:hypothetical protein